MTAEPNALLSTPLASLSFPTRVENFIARRGLATVADLLVFTPSALALEPNLGRKSIADIRNVLEEHLRISWESARRYVVPGDEASRTPALPPSEEWASLRARIAPELLERHVADVEELPARLQTFAARERLRTIADLLTLDYEQVVTAPGVGAGTLRSTLDFFRTRSGPAAPPSTLRDVEAPLPPGSTWRSALQGSLRALASNERLILTQRSGLAGPIPTLAELGECLGVSRERIRQLESRALERIRRAAWVTAAKERFERAAPEAGTALLALWNPDDELFVVADEDVEAFAFFVRDVLRASFDVFRIEDRWLITRLERDALEDQLRTARSQAERLEYPLALGEHLVALARSLGSSPEDIAVVSALLEDEWIVEGDHVTGFGTTKRRAVLAFVRAAKRPVAKSELEARFGRVHLRDDFIFVDHGLLALPETIPDWERWRRRIPSAVRSLLERHGPERQWTTHEVLPLLSEEAELPPWLNEWTLGSLLRDAAEVRYLGRNVITLDDTAEGRLHVHELTVAELEAAKGPLDEDALLAALREKRGLGPNTWMLLRMRRPFLLFEDGRVGLMPRDVAGGAEAARGFCDMVFAHLDKRQAGIQGNDLRALLDGESDPISSWDVRLARSLLRHDGRFRSAPGGAIGLAEWEDVRAPSQREVLEELMIEHEGIVPVEVAMRALPTTSGEPLSRGRIGLLANSIRARLVGPYIEWMPEDSRRRSSATSPLVDQVLAALPEDSAGVFAELIAADGPASDMQEAIQAWAELLRAEAGSNPHIELDQVERLAARGHTLLERHATTDDPDVAKLASAAVRYLVSMDDALSDRALGGLDDDETVIEAVLAVLDPR